MWTKQPIMVSRHCSLPPQTNEHLRAYHLGAIEASPLLRNVRMAVRFEHLEQLASRAVPSNSGIDLAPSLSTATYTDTHRRRLGSSAALKVSGWRGGAHWMTKIRHSGDWNEPYQDVTSGLDFRSRTHAPRGRSRNLSGRTAGAAIYFAAPVRAAPHANSAQPLESGCWGLSALGNSSFSSRRRCICSAQRLAKHARAQHPGGSKQDRVRFDPRWALANLVFWA